MINEVIVSNVTNVNVRIGTSTMDIADTWQRISSLHYHDEIELLIVNEGKMKLSSPGGEWIFGAGEVVLISSRVVHETFGQSGAHSSSFLQFNIFDYLEDVGKNMMHFINFKDEPIIHFNMGCEKTSEISGLAHKIFSEYNEKDTAYEVSIKGTMYSLIAFLLRNGIVKDYRHLPQGAQIERLLPIIEYIDKNYSEKITTHDLGELLHLNSDYLCRFFKKTVGSTIGDYINFVRVKKAELLLSTARKTISEVALDTGFSSVSYFNRVFQKYKNCSPSSYKKIKFSHQ